MLQLSWFRRASLPSALGHSPGPPRGKDSSCAPPVTGKVNHRHPGGWEAQRREIDLSIALSQAIDSILQCCVRMWLVVGVLFRPKLCPSHVSDESGCDWKELCLRTEELPRKVLKSLSYVQKWAWATLEELDP